MSWAVINNPALLLRGPGREEAAEAAQQLQDERVSAAGRAHVVLLHQCALDVRLQSAESTSRRA